MAVPKTPTIQFNAIGQSYAVIAVNTDPKDFTQVLEWEIGFSHVKTAISSTTSSTTQNVIVAWVVNPSTKYYFWGRVRNADGWSAWSPIKTATLLAGAFVKVGPVWKRAIPYVRTGGAWKMAQPMGSTMGNWKKAL